MGVVVRTLGLELGLACLVQGSRAGPDTGLDLLAAAPADDRVAAEVNEDLQALNEARANPAVHRREHRFDLVETHSPRECGMRIDCIDDAVTDGTTVEGDRLSGDLEGANESTHELNSC